MSKLPELVRTNAGAAAAQILSAAPDSGWIDQLIHELSAGRSRSDLQSVLDVWGISQAEFASLMGVSRQAVGKWLRDLPSERAVAIADLAAASEVLVHYVRRERIPAVVRRPAPALGGHSLVDLIAQGDTAAVLTAVRNMFDPSRIGA